MRITTSQTFCACSFITLAGAYGFLLQFEHGAQVSSATFPSNAKSAIPGRQRTIYCFVSSDCPCSLSTIANLGRVADENFQYLAIKVVVCQADAKAAARYVGRAVSSATANKFEITPDPAGAIARRFGATSSGTTLFFDTKGACLFKGGITDFRGVQGESLGLGLLRKYATGAETHVVSLPVLGCAFPQEK